ncbi:MAG: type II toxin-antitoxin system HicB family antitoxin [Dehalococcoidia bacterium]|nr:type II toxin-antitoxin system HicB family antitoxin [Dehalococcoidia bacterium]
MQYVYPAVFHPEKSGGYSIRFPDIRMGGTQGETLAEGIKLATDFLVFALHHIESEGAKIPTPSANSDIETESGDIITLIVADTDVARRFYEDKLVRKNLNIPHWLNERAVAAGVNFSSVLQAALKEKLQLTEAK